MAPARRAARPGARLKILRGMRTTGAAPVLLSLALRAAAAPAARSELKAFCYDRRTDCPNWARDGECTGPNGDAVLATCPLSCHVCSQDSCEDTMASCEQWAREGMCKTRPKTMLKACSMSCGVCNTECRDNHDDCSHWGATGECNEHPEFMIEACPVTCGSCVRTCRDRDDSCPQWTAQGSCWRDPAFMLRQCPQSCGACEAKEGELSGVCEDKAPAANCTAWHAAGECDTNPNFVMHQCSDMCGLCDTVCADQFDMCLEWAAGGQCEANRAFMYRNCPASCALCARVRRAGMHGAKARRSGQGDAARESLPEKTEL